MKINVSYVYSKKNLTANSSIENILLNIRRNLKKKLFIKLINEKNFFHNINYLFKSKIIHLHGCWNMIFFLCFIIGKILKKKIIFSPHGMLDPESLKIKKLKKNLAWNIYQKNIFFNSYIICNSYLEKKNLKKINFNSNISVINHGVDINHHCFTRDLKRPKFLVFSRIHPIKNILELILIWKKSNYLKKFNLDIYGEIDNFDYFKKIEELIKDEKKINYKFPLNKNNKFQFISKYNIYLFPSSTENFGITVLETLSCGLYVICGKKLPWKILEKFGLGKLIIFSKKNLEEAVKKIIKINSRTSINNFKKKIFLFLNKKYSWPIISKKYLNIYLKNI